MDSCEKSKKELIVGYDLCNDYSQISYFNFTNAEPKTISTTAGEERFQIPTVLLKKKGLDKWFFGDEALKKALNGEELLVKDILDKGIHNEVTVIEDKEYVPAQLLETFIRKTLSLFAYEGIAQKIPDVIVFTLEHIDRNLTATIKQSAKAIGICEDHIYIQSHDESFVEYTLNQKRELWSYDVVLLDYCRDYLKAYYLKINTKTTPIFVTIDKKNFKDIEMPPTSFLPDSEEEKRKKLDQTVKDALKNYFGVNIISCVFLCGDGFESTLSKETLRFLCSGRRVFQGKNLYTKGACYTGAAKFIDTQTENYLFFSENKIKYNVGLDVFYQGEKKYHSLITAGENWYDAKGECELILDEESCVELKFTPIDNQDTRNIIINLHELPNRPNKTIRVQLYVKFECANIGTAIIKDLGFGEFFKSSEKIWKHEILL
ncbi:hypothetical protein C8E03_106117 [Lachnotalea glycerini]|uniref:DUF5716 domain-containing protein n=1 Tax=Lachnotalea glycerini TaxID=1763509 RepID=A0A318EL52_9FIRM|nr:DUF5716 family protein [Lachnotalea glycerini]PXV89466.1 hypothetical protein C8E03_106117 [Lachnotalea glycerini]